MMKLNGFGLLAATLSAFALVSMPHSAQAGPPGRGHCPPGLAKKNPPCIPPGQAKKYYPGDIIHGWRHHDRIYHDDYGLRRPGAGHRYIRVGSDIYLIAEATQRVIEVINLLGR